MNKKNTKRKVGLIILAVWLFNIVMLIFFFSGFLPNDLTSNKFYLFASLILLISVLILFPVWAFLIGKKLLRIISLVPVGFVALAYLVFLIANPHKVVGRLMEPVLVNKSYFLAERWSYFFSAPKRGELIVYKGPTMDRMGRIVGMPGERIDVVNRKVFVNGKELSEPYSKWTNYDYASPYGFTLGDDEYWAPYDSRISLDLTGAILKIHNITGKITYVYWPAQNRGSVSPQAGVLTTEDLRNEKETVLAQPTCKTLGTKLVTISPPPNYQTQIGCDVEVIGQFDLSKSYCESKYQHKIANLVPDFYGRSNRYYATLNDVDFREEVDVFIYSQSGERIFCNPPLNLE